MGAPIGRKDHCPDRRLRAFALNLSDEPNDHWPDACDMVERSSGAYCRHNKPVDHFHGSLNADLFDVRIHLAFGVLILTEIGTDLLTHQIIDRTDRLAWMQREAAHRGLGFPVQWQIDLTFAEPVATRGTNDADF
jgi:hypothetical protein